MACNRDNDLELLLLSKHYTDEQIEAMKAEVDAEIKAITVHGYNDSEIRAEIEDLKKDKADIDTLDKAFYTKTQSDSRFVTHAELNGYIPGGSHYTKQEANKIFIDRNEIQSYLLIDDYEEHRAIDKKYLECKLCKIDKKFDKIESSIADLAQDIETIPRIDIIEYDTLKNRVSKLELDSSDYQKALNILNSRTSALTDLITGTETQKGLVDKVAENTAAIIDECIARSHGDQAILDKIGTIAEGKTIVTLINDAITEVKKYADDNDADTVYDDTDVKNRIQAIEDDYLTSEDIYDDTALNNRVTAIEDDYLKHEDKYDDSALSNRIKAIEDDYLTEDDKYDDTALTSKVTALETLSTDHESRISKVENFFETADGESLSTAMDTLIEIQKEIASDNEGAAAMLAGITANTEAIAKLNSDATTYATKNDLTSAIDEIEQALDDYVKELDINQTISDLTADLNEKIEEATISHATDSVPEGVRKIDNTLNIVVDAFTRAETIDKIQDVTNALDEYIDTTDVRITAIEEKNTSQDVAIVTAVSSIEAKLEEYYTKPEIETLIKTLNGLKIEVADNPADTPEELAAIVVNPHVIYLIPNNDGTQDDYSFYIEYMLIENSIERIGSTDIDLSGYVTSKDLEKALLELVADIDDINNRITQVNENISMISAAMSVADAHLQEAVEAVDNKVSRINTFNGSDGKLYQFRFEMSGTQPTLIYEEIRTEGEEME